MSLDRIEQAIGQIKRRKMRFVRTGRLGFPAPEGFTSGDLKELRERLKKLGIKCNAQLTRPPRIVLTDIKKKR